MEFLPNGLTLDIPPGAFLLSTDSMVLADFAKPGKRMLDLGSGCGTLGLLLCARHEHCHITGIEIDKAAHAAALENITRNNLSPRMHSICGDLRQVNRILSPGSVDVCLSNPPYFSGGPASKAAPLARREDCCSPGELFQAAAHSLRYGGDFYLVHKPERLGQLCGCAIQAGLEPKRLRLIRHREGGEVTLILLQCRKGGKPGLIWEEISLFDNQNQPTEYYKTLYHISNQENCTNKRNLP